MTKPRNGPPRPPKKSQIAKAREVEKMVQAAKAKPRYQQTKFHTRRQRPQIERCSDGSNLLMTEGGQVRLPIAQHPPERLPPRPSTRTLFPLGSPVAPNVQTLPLTSYSEIEIDGASFLMKDERHNSLGFVPVPLVINLPKSPVTRKTPFRFLDLPNEIQDLIFEQAIPSTKFDIFWVNRNHKSKSLTHNRHRSGLPKLPPDVLDRRLRQQRRPDADRRAILSHVYRSRTSPVALLWVNRQFYLRASRVFYLKSIFTFHNLQPFRHFLDTVSPPNKDAIRSLNLVYTPYGHPARRSDAVWKTVHDRAWLDLCVRTATELPHLRSLDLELRMHSTPLAFAPLDLPTLARSQDFRTEWLVPLCVLKEGLKVLDRCCVRILSHVRAETVLEVESWQLRRQILGNRWDERRESERDAYGVEKVRKGGCRILRIVT